jgi:UDP-3-O-[3-hydroxymyristoyl] glucosamine N-acyltransferase
VFIVTTRYSLQFLAESTQGTVFGDSGKMISGVAPFETAQKDEATFAGGAKYVKKLKESEAGVIFVPEGVESSGKDLIQVKNPQLAFAKVVGMFHETPLPVPGTSEKACVGTDVVTGDQVSIGAFTTIGNRVNIGSGSIVHNNVFIGDDVEIGDQVVIFPNVTVMNRSRIGNRVVIQAGSVIGSDGYGFISDEGRHHKIPQIGIVQIDDDVEIGSCNTIDRATFGRTWIQRGVKTDNLVHIAHNVVVGEDSLVVAQVGIAGSTKIGHHAILAGQAGISGHLTIGDQVIIGPMTGVAKSIPDGEIVSSGTNAMPHRTWLRVQRVIPRLPDLQKKISELEKKIASLEKKE